MALSYRLVATLADLLAALLADLDGRLVKGRSGPAAPSGPASRSGPASQ